MPAQILLRLMVEPDGAMTTAALSASLELSPAAVSSAIRFLGLLGFIRTDVLPGTRRHRYSLPILPWYASTLIRDRYGPLRALLEAGIDELEPGAARDRLSEMADFFRFLHSEMPLLWDRWQRTRP